MIDPSLPADLTARIEALKLNNPWPKTEGRSGYNSAIADVLALVETRSETEKTRPSGASVTEEGTGSRPLPRITWRPFATAPRDGQHIIAATKFMGHPVVEVIWWDSRCGWQGAQGEQRFDAWMPPADLLSLPI
jgi:hypothetical protein